METAIQFLIGISALLAVLTVAAFVADYIIGPLLGHDNPDEHENNHF